MKRKTFKKWIMSLDGFTRNDADYICDMVRRFGKSYSAIYTDNAHDPCLSGILDAILEGGLSMRNETWQDRLKELEKNLENKVMNGEITEEEASEQYNKAYVEEYCNAHPFL